MHEYCVIRNDREVFVTEKRLTQEEREQIEERKHSPEARRRFGVELRRVRRPEVIAYKAVMKLLEAKPLGRRILTLGELEACLVGAPKHVRKRMYRLFDGNFLGDLPQNARDFTDEQLYHLPSHKATRQHVLEMLRRGVWPRKLLREGVIILGQREAIRPFAEAAADPIRGTPHSHGVLGTRAEVEQLNRECVAFGEALGPHLARYLSPGGGSQ